MWGVIVAGILLLDNRFDLDAIGWEVAVVAILFWVVGVIYMLIYAKKNFKSCEKEIFHDQSRTTYILCGIHGNRSRSIVQII